MLRVARVADVDEFDSEIAMRCEEHIASQLHSRRKFDRIIVLQEFRLLWIGRIDDEQTIVPGADVGDAVSDYQLTDFSQPAEFAEHFRLEWVGNINHMEGSAADRIGE